MDTNTFGTGRTMEEALANLRQKQARAAGQGAGAIVSMLIALIEGVVAKTVRTVMRDECATQRKLDRDAQTPEATWVNEHGEVMRLSDMPTRYLVNVDRFLERRGVGLAGPGSGLRLALEREVAAREAQEGKAA